jgi:hypothetical protein
MRLSLLEVLTGILLGISLARLPELFLAMVDERKSLGLWPYQCLNSTSRTDLSIK